ncbi:uncharacterized protein PAC_05888 [Phialocephala subalpina]|uniref:Uncharacterized protein n=1 Tax=Phialocephala subalpina TaxID=576137 RepID=A0A1L7WTA7_9HELO|nr:uncharacterized protein PAC_05888 [Phialocephala subalpina]
MDPGRLLLANQLSTLAELVNINRVLTRKLYEKYQEIGYLKEQWNDAEIHLTDTLTELQGHNQRLLSSELMRVNIESRSDIDNAFFISKYQHLQVPASTSQYQNMNLELLLKFWGEQRKRGILYSPHNVPEHPSIHNDMEELSEDCRNLLIGSEDGSTKPFVTEAFLWKYIEDNMFHSIQSPASYRPKAPVAELRMFYKCKANTAELIIKRLKPPIARTRIHVDPAVMDYMVTQVWHVIGEWITKSEKSAGHEDACRKDLRVVLQAATDLNSYIHEEWSFILTSAL